MHKYYIEKIVEFNNKEKMEELREILVDTISYLKGIDYEKYRSIECKLYEIVEGKKLTEEKAKEWVASMKPAAIWTIEDTDKVKNEYKVDIPSVDFFALMNKLYTDYNDIFEENIDIYVKMAKDWYFDIDSSKKGSEKLYCYWKNIIN